jgi:hypothetical protein
VAVVTRWIERLKDFLFNYNEDIITGLLVSLVLLAILALVAYGIASGPSPCR